MVAGSRKAVQHPTGGLVRHIRVHEGERVEAGQVLLEMDATQARAQADGLFAQYLAALASLARLSAERDERRGSSFPPSCWRWTTRACRPCWNSSGSCTTAVGGRCAWNSMVSPRRSPAARRNWTACKPRCAARAAARRPRGTVARPAPTGQRGLRAAQPPARQRAPAGPGQRRDRRRPRQPRQYPPADPRTAPAHGPAAGEVPGRGARQPGRRPGARRGVAQSPGQRALRPGQQRGTGAGRRPGGRPGSVHRGRRDRARPATDGNPPGAPAAAGGRSAAGGDGRQGPRRLAGGADVQRLQPEHYAAGGGRSDPGFGRPPAGRAQRGAVLPGASA